MIGFHLHSSVSGAWMPRVVSSVGRAGTLNHRVRGSSPSQPTLQSVSSKSPNDSGGNEMDYERLNSDVEEHLTDDFTIERYKQMLQGIKTNPIRILDVGVGSGNGGRVIHNLFPNAKIFGIDAVKARTISQNSFYHEIRYESAIQTTFSDDYFDVILAGEIIEHIAISDIENFLHEIYRLLKIGGYFCFTTPNPQDIKLRARGGTVLGGSHLSQHFIRETKSRLRMNGFRVTKCRGTGRTSRYLGTLFPKNLYGSYLIVSLKK